MENPFTKTSPRNLIYLKDEIKRWRQLLELTSYLVPKHNRIGRTMSGAPLTENVMNVGKIAKRKQYR
jgi:hypothetical protein